MFAGLGLEQELGDLEIEEDAQQELHDRTGAGFEEVLHVAGVDPLGGGGILTDADLEASLAVEREDPLGFGALSQGVHEPAEQDFDLVNLVASEHLPGALGYGLAFAESGGVVVGEFGHQLTLGAGQELGAFASDRHEQGGGGVVAGDLAEQVSVEGAAQALVCADDNHSAFAHLALFQQGMGEVLRPIRRVVHDQGGQVGKRPAANGGLLGPLHF